MAKAAARPFSVVETQYGKVRGAVVEGVHIFRGIPYGGLTEGPGRFLPPTSPTPWAGLREALVTGPRCIQPPGNIFLDPLIGEYFGGGRPDRVELAQQTDSENCLVLNVLTLGPSGKRPVMVYIHGGGYAVGSSVLTLFSDAFVREQDIVLVGINHRLNVFGYTYLGALSEKYALGNVGQLDLIAALEWVRDNIAAFGGDPENVTVFGESGGGGKISTLMGMPAAKGLFQRAIVESGSLLRAGDMEQGSALARALLAELNLDAKQVDELQRVPADKLLGAALTSPDPANVVPGLLRFGPIVEGRSLPQQPWEPHAPALAADIPVIIGCCKHEGTLFTLANSALFALDWAGLRAQLIQEGLAEADVDPLLALYRRDHPQESPSDLYFRIRTDRTLRARAIQQAELKLAQGRANVYMYYFAWDTPCADGKIRAFHTAELPLAMRLVRYPEAEQLSRQISGAWAAFARSGDPNHSGLPTWPPYTIPQRATMAFDAQQSYVVNDPAGEERVFLRDRPSPDLL